MASDLLPSFLAPLFLLLFMQISASFTCASLLPSFFFFNSSISFTCIPSLCQSHPPLFHLTHLRFCFPPNSHQPFSSKHQPRLPQAFLVLSPLVDEKISFTLLSISLFPPEPLHPILQSPQQHTHTLLTEGL